MTDDMESTTYFLAEGVKREMAHGSYFPAIIAYRDGIEVLVNHPDEIKQGEPFRVVKTSDNKSHSPKELGCSCASCSSTKG